MPFGRRRIGFFDKGTYMVRNGAGAGSYFRTRPDIAVPGFRRIRRHAKRDDEAVRRQSTAALDGCPKRRLVHDYVIRG